MAKGQKKQAGANEKRTVLQLQPAKYQISLLYLGPDRIRRDNATYRCRFELHEGENPIAGKPARIPNQVLIAPPPNPPAPAPGAAPGGGPGVGGAGAGGTGDIPAPTTPDEKAATPAAQGGDASNPVNDRVYRVVILDNHGTRSDDQLCDNAHGCGLIGRGGNPDGDRISKPENFASTANGKIDWMPDVRAVVPFRVIVRKFYGNEQVDLEDAQKSKALKVVFEVKDPVEEFAQNDGRRREFLQEFYGKYNRTDKMPYPGDGTPPAAGDDNAVTTFRGIRQPSASNPGVKATDVLRKLPYANPPVIEEPITNTPPEGGPATFASLQAPAAHGNMNAKFDLTEATEKSGDQEFKVGIADLGFCPWKTDGGPDFGDNYRFLLTLMDSGDKDVREKDENGVKAQLLDHNRQVILRPRAYTTGRFVIWRRANVKLVVLVNVTQPGDINWNDARAVYRTAFTELVPPPAPAGFHRLTAAHWIAKLKEEFTSAADRTTLDNIAAQPDFNDVYQQYFFPLALRNNHMDAGIADIDDRRSAADNALTGHIATAARRIIKLACDNVVPQVTAPDANDGAGKGVAQRDAEGFFLMVCRSLTPTSGLLGSSFGDRMFWFACNLVAVAHNADGSAVPATPPGDVPGRLANTTSTVTHEMGHAQYLRHSHTTAAGARWNPGAPLNPPAPPAAPPGPSDIQLYDSRSNNQIMDHDQVGAFQCFMSYSAADTPIPLPCGVCQLTMRFYDRVRLQAAGNYQNEIFAGQSPAEIVRAVRAANGRWTLTQPNEPAANQLAQLPTLHLHGAPTTYDVIAVGPPRTFQHFDGAQAAGVARTCRVNITAADNRTQDLWDADPNGIVRLEPLGGNPPGSAPNRIRVTALAAGTVTIRYRKAGVTASARLQVQDP